MGWLRLLRVTLQVTHRLYAAINRLSCLDFPTFLVLCVFVAAAKKQKAKLAKPAITPACAAVSKLPEPPKSQPPASLYAATVTSAAPEVNARPEPATLCPAVLEPRPLEDNVADMLSATGLSPPETVSKGSQPPQDRPPRPLECLVLPARSVGDFTLGTPLGVVVRMLNDSESAIPKVQCMYNESDPLANDIVLYLSLNGICLRFDPQSQRLKLIELFDLARLNLYYKDVEFKYGEGSTLRGIRTLAHRLASCIAAPIKFSQHSIRSTGYLVQSIL
ncbi:hypothetical protein HDU86_001380 [Geranomyces michiganensis]|nr:hypothetical protein HDU86_001380 [Geranomyces michiganensis]